LDTNNLIIIILLIKDTASGDIQWYFSQVKGTMEDEVNEGE
jgi:hypothetical protein